MEKAGRSSRKPTSENEVADHSVAGQTVSRNDGHCERHCVNQAKKHRSPVDVFLHLAVLPTEAQSARDNQQLPAKNLSEDASQRKSFLSYALG